MRKLLCLSIFLMMFSVNILAAEKRIMSIDEVMHLAEINSPQLSADRFRELAAKKSVDIARANYFPTLSFEALDSSGFPGSSAATGVTGLMDSPYRKGLTGGLVAEQIVYDFGRTYYDVEASKHESEYTQQNTRVSIYQIKQLALQTFYECTFFQAQQKKWEILAKESCIITKEAQHFVNTGQRSIVDRYLSKAQTEEAETAQAFYATRVKESIHRLAVIMGTGDENFTCPFLPHQLTSSLNPNIGFESSPLLTRAIVGTKVAQSRLKQEKAKFFPKIVAVASAGEMSSSRLEPKKEYAAGIGLIFPIVDFHITGEIQRAKAVASAKAKDVEAEKQYLGEMNAKYDEIIKSSQVKLKHLSYEYELAIKGFKAAKQRYFSLEGDLIDLREAWRNRARVETEVDQTRTQLLQASGSKALLNGGGE